MYLIAVPTTSIVPDTEQAFGLTDVALTGRDRTLKANVIATKAASTFHVLRLDLRNFAINKCEEEFFPEPKKEI